MDYINNCCCCLLSFHINLHFFLTLECQCGMTTGRMNEAQSKFNLECAKTYESSISKNYLGANNDFRFFSAFDPLTASVAMPVNVFTLSQPPVAVNLEKYYLRKVFICDPIRQLGSSKNFCCPKCKSSGSLKFKSWISNSGGPSDDLETTNGNIALPLSSSSASSKSYIGRYVVT